MTHGSLRREIPTLEPDEDFVARLAGLAAASRPSRGGVVVPVAFGGPASRAVVVATAVAALTAGAAAAAQLGHPSRDVPAPPVTSTGIQRPQDAEHPGEAEARELAHRTEVSGEVAGQVGQHDAVVHHPSPGGSTIAADPRVPTRHETGDDQTGDDQTGDDQTGDDQTGGNDGHDDQGDSSGGRGTDDSGESDGTSGDSGGSDDGTTSDGSQDGGGTQSGSDDGSDAGSTSGSSSLLNGDSD